MNCIEAMEKLIFSLNEEDVALFNLGLNSRIAYSFKDRKYNFYMLGSMGLVSSVGLGLALSCDKKVFIFDGDGSLLMDMGIMSMIGPLKCKNLIHIVFDNEAYCSTGNQATYTDKIDLASAAEVYGYNTVIKLESIEECDDFASSVHSLDGSVFCLIKSDTCSVNDFPRVALLPVDIAGRFRSAVLLQGNR